MKNQLKIILLITSVFFFCCSADRNDENQVIDQSIESSGFNNYLDAANDESKPLNERKTNINQAYHLVKNGGKDSLMMLVLYRKTNLHSRTKEIDSALYFSRQYLKIALKAKDSIRMGNANFKLALYLEKLNNVDSSYIHYNQSRIIFEALGDSLRIAKRLLNMAIILSRSGNYSQSDEHVIEGIRFLNNSDDKTTLGSMYNCLAINAKLQEDYTESLYWYKKAIETTDNVKNKNIYLSNVANIYRISEDYTKAIALNKLLLTDPLIINDPNHYARILDNLTYTQWLFTKDRSLESDFLKALEMRTKEKNIYGQISSHNHLSEFYAESNPVKARIHAKKMYDLANKMNNVDDRLASLRLLMRFSEEKPKDYKFYANRYIHLDDSIQNVRIKEGLLFSKIKYDVAKTRTENEALKLKDTENQLSLEKTKRMNSFYIALGVISVFVFAFLMLFSRERFKKEKLEEVMLTESRISKRVHDEVANDLYQAMNRVENRDGRNEILLNDLERIYSKTRDISRENNALDLSQDFDELINDLMRSFQKDDVNIITKGLHQIDWNKLNSLKKTAVFRVVQELLTNMKKHSQAELVILSFKQNKEKLILNYSDDGIGCDIKKNNGLLNAENRILSLNGKFTLQSIKNKGFKATITV